MPAAAPPVGPNASTALAALGAQLRERRKALGVSAVTTAEAAGMSRTTLHRIETGEPSVTLGAFAAAADAVGLTLQLFDPLAPPPTTTTGATTTLPAAVALAALPQLRRLAWQLREDSTVTPREALSLYERNWRHVDTAALDDDERALIRQLVATFGGTLRV